MVGAFGWPNILLVFVDDPKALVPAGVLPNALGVVVFVFVF